MKSRYPFYLNLKYLKKAFNLINKIQKIRESDEVAEMKNSGKCGVFQNALKKFEGRKDTITRLIPFLNLLIRR